MLHGPFYHGLNKGGLEEILATQQLRASAARPIAGGAEAVRAIRVREGEQGIGAGTGHTTLEFYCVTPPEPNQAPGMATWYMPEGEHLSVVITRVGHDNGRIEEFHPTVQPCGCCWDWSRPW